MKSILLALGLILILPSCLVTSGDLEKFEGNVATIMAANAEGALSPEETLDAIGDAAKVTADEVEARFEAGVENAKAAGLTLLLQALGLGGVGAGAFAGRKKIGAVLAGSPPPAAPSA